MYQYGTRWNDTDRERKQYSEGEKKTCHSGTLFTTNPKGIGLVFDFDVHAERPANVLSNNMERKFETGHTVSLCWQKYDKLNED